MRNLSFTRRGASALLAAAVGLGAVLAAVELHPGRLGARPVADAGALAPASCTTGLTPVPGFVIDLCLSGQGSSVTPAVIVHQDGHIASSCQITLGVFDDANNRLDDSSQAVPLPCTTGEHDGAALDLNRLSGITTHTAPDGSITVHASADLTVDGQETNLGASPTYTASQSAGPGQSPGSTPPNSPSPTPTPIPSPTSGANKYDAAGAAAWARANAYTDGIGAINPDCTDFVSTAMHEGGGLPMAGDMNFFDRSDENAWWRVTTDGRPGAASYNWTDARDLEAYLIRSGRGTQVSEQDAKPGDVIFVNWGPGGNDTPENNQPGQDGIDHVGMIVGNPDEGGDGLQIAQHTRDTIETLANWRAQNPNLQIWVYSISYS